MMQKNHVFLIKARRGWIALIYTTQIQKEYDCHLKMGREGEMNYLNKRTSLEQEHEYKLTSNIFKLTAAQKDKTSNFFNEKRLSGLRKNIISYSSVIQRY